jgi:hypothetical protein
MTMMKLNKREYKHLGRQGVIVDPKYVVSFLGLDWGSNTVGPKEILMGLRLELELRTDRKWLRFLKDSGKEVVRIGPPVGATLLEIDLKQLNRRAR